MSAKSYLPPDGRMLTPYLCCREAGRAIDWYAGILGARLADDPYVGPDGRIGHAELELDGAVFMLSDGYPDFGVDAPAEDRLPTYALYLYVPDVDATTAAAERAGATVQRGPEDEADGSRRSTVLDPFGVRWMFATYQREPSAEEIAASRAEFTGN